MTTRNLPFYSFPTNVTTFPNGLTAISKEIPTIRQRFEIGFASGSMVEKIPGTAHYLEHMLAGGPSRTDIHPAYRELFPKGMDKNACTNLFSTRYHAESRAEHAEELLRALVHQVFRPEFNQQVLESERGAIVAEYWQRKEGQSFNLWKASHLIGADSPFARAVVGTPESIASITLDDLRSFYELEYGLSNCVIISTGGISHSTFLSLITKSGIPDAPLGERRRYTPVAPGVSTLTYRKKHETASTQIYWPIDMPREDSMAVGLALDLLTDAPLGSLMKILRGELGIAYSIRAGADRSPVQVATLETWINEKYFSTFHDVTRSALQALAQGDVPLALFDALKSRRRTNIETTRESLNCHRPADVLFGDWMDDEYLDFDRLERLRNITPETVAMVAKKHLLPTSPGRIDRVPE